MALLLAQLSQDASEERRRSGRRMLRLGAAVGAGLPSWRAVILNLSETGLMLHTAGPLAVNDMFEVELPEVGLIEAQVVWANGTDYGCQFVNPISKAAVSAALLKSPFDEDAAKQLERGTDEVRAEWERPPSRLVEIALNLSLLTLLIVISLFVFAFLELPFSTEQG